MATAGCPIFDWHINSVKPDRQYSPESIFQKNIM
jgi:hypothetical protein